jgi:prephenate dehydrogenase
VKDAQLVILASPIGTFEDLLKEMAPALPPGCIVTDVGSTKVLPVRWARKYLPKNVQFLGSHPMAGSEQRGVDFARDDLFNGANCILTPTSDTSGDTIRYLKNFWKQLGTRIQQMSPAKHDRVMGRISHLPHALAVALVNISEPDQMLLCGRGFLDTTRIASGPPGLWHDILMGNAGNMETAIAKLVKELQQIKKALHQNDSKAITKMLTDAQVKRNALVKKKMQRRELPE